jgi:hypothetical protein
MMIQGLNNYHPVPGSIKSDSLNRSQGFGNILEAIKSGNLDQTSLSGNTLLQTLSQLTGLNNFQPANSNDPNQKTPRGDFRNLLRSVNESVRAIESGNQEQITITQTTLQQTTAQFQNDLNNIQPSSSNGPNQNSVQTDFQNFQNAVTALLDAHKSGNQDQIKAAQDALQKTTTQLQADVPELQPIQGRSHHPQYPFNGGNNEIGHSGYNRVVNNLLSYLSAVTGSENYGQSQGPNTGILSLKA